MPAPVSERRYREALIVAEALCSIARYAHRMGEPVFTQAHVRRRAVDALGVARDWRLRVRGEGETADGS